VHKYQKHVAKKRSFYVVCVILTERF